MNSPAQRRSTTPAPTIAKTFAPRWRSICLSTTLLSASLFAAPAHAADWRDALAARVERIDRDSPGNIGFYVKRLDSGESYAYHADRPWYLGSSSKLAVAIAVLQDVDAGKRRLDDKLVLKETDKTDGSGNLVWQAAGSVRRLDWLVERMLMVSDNTAANLLIRTLGIDALNDRARDYFGPKGVEKLTDFTQIRYDVYAELHPDARKLTNRQLVQIAAAPMGPQRVDAFRRMLSLDASQLNAKTIDEAYARYYTRKLNEATLVGYAGMMEKMVTGKLLSPQSTRLLFTDLKYDTYDAYRLEAGLPKTVRFIHKTGTQFQRACHMGVVDPQDGGRHAILVATCAEGMDEHKTAGEVFERLGRSITETMLVGAPDTVSAR